MIAYAGPDQLEPEFLQDTERAPIVLETLTMNQIQPQGFESEFNKQTASRRGITLPPIGSPDPIADAPLSILHFKKANGPNNVTISTHSKAIIRSGCPLPFTRFDPADCPTRGIGMWNGCRGCNGKSGRKLLYGNGVLGGNWLNKYYARPHYPEILSLC
jgi:hypothetical protein